jgi:cation diffusion facilitator family transporter
VHIIAVFFAAYSMWLIHQPADPSHPYGHDKVAYFSAGFEGFLILLAAAYIIYESVTKLLGTIELSNLDVGTYIILGASSTNLALGLYLVRTGKKTNSLILVADGKHILTDSWTSFGVVAALLLALVTGWLIIDPLIAIVFALNIVWSGSKLIRQSIGGLMDEANPEFTAQARAVLERETTSRGLLYHEFRSRQTGNAIWVEFHLLFPRETLLEQAHRDASDIESVLAAELPLPVKVASHLECIDRHDEHHGSELRH